MHIYVCEQDIESIFTAIYDAWSSGYGYRNIKLTLGPVEQYSLFDEYTHVVADAKKAESVTQAIRKKVSNYAYRQIAYCAMAYEKDMPDILYRVLLLAFHYGAEALDYVQYKEVMRFRQIGTRLSKEVNRFQEFSRFHEVQKGLYVSHVEPKSRLVVALGPIFEDRMPSEHFIIVDDVHREAVIHPKDEPFFVKQLSDREYRSLLETEEANDEYTDLWKTFFETIAIEQRINPKCQRNLMPLWSRKHSVEFN